MKLILFSGTHPRHLFVNRNIPQYFDETLVILMQREELIPEPPENLLPHDKQLFKKHFQDRHIAESAAYGTLQADEVFGNLRTIYVKPDELNTESVAEAIEEFNADFSFIFGVDLILDPVIGKLPRDKINLHLGLSPWYKGGATLYWPFYFLQPQFCGSTFHQITHNADAGEIIHQCVPVLERGDRIHDVGVKCVLKAVQDIPRIFEHWFAEGKFSGSVQKTSGRNWRGVDFHASQLRVIYDLFDERIVDAYLDGDLEQRKPALFSCIR
jgi:folate-dependent phosphoribosylglycinamide formyltransferase PurN